MITDTDIRQLLHEREQTSRSREQYKDKKTKRKNYSSQLSSEDVNGVEVSEETCLLAQRQASVPLAVASCNSPFESATASPEESGSVISPRDVCSRYSGITVQHAKTTKGVKLAVTLQKPEWTAQGACQLVTAELKRYDRMREVRAREHDSEHFASYLHTVKQQLQDSQDRTVCVGRLHQRGRRSAWLYDTLIVARLEHNLVTSVMLYLEGEEQVIVMDTALTDLQQQYYHTQGRWGQVVSAQRAPRLDDLPLTRFGGL
jgi:hypothetical protein